MVIPPQIGQWLQPETLDAAVLAAVPELHLPLALELGRRARLHGAPFTIGLCAAQGSGKTTAARVLTRLLAVQGLATVALSIDDFYLTREQRAELGSRVHPLLATRGVPGTHDIGLAIATLQSLRAGRPTALPSFDKATDERLPQSCWRSVQPAVDILILEGWCVGAVPQPTSALAVPINPLERDLDPQLLWRGYVNESLVRYQELFALLDMLVLLAAPGFEVVHRWRSEQEAQLRMAVSQAGGPTTGLMDEMELQRFIAQYERLTRHILDEMPQRADIVITLDAQRRPLQPWRIRG